MVKKITKKKITQVSRRKQYILLAMTVTAVSVFAIYYSNKYYSTNDGILNLKDEIMKTKQIVNDAGYTASYREGCVGKGGVYNDDEPSSCYVGLVFDAKRDANEMVLLDNYINTLKKMIHLSSTSLQDSIHLQRMRVIYLTPQLLLN